MYYSMNGTGSIGETVLIDSQNPTAGSYDPATHQPVNAAGAAPKWWEQLLNTTNKALDTFNPNIPQQPVAAQPGYDWSKMIVPILGIGAAVGLAYYVTRPKKSTKK